MKSVLLNTFTALALGLSALVPSVAAAQPAAVVEGVQMPAWVERAEAGGIRKIPVVPGMQLKAGDKLVTGEGSRL